MGKGRAYNRRVLLLRATAVLIAACLTLHCAKAPPPPTGKAAAFDLPDLAGGEVSLESLKGQVVVLDFWATWCGPCIKEMPDFAEFYQKNKPRGVEVLGIILDSGEPQDVVDFLREFRTPYRQLLGSGKVQSDYGNIEGFPHHLSRRRRGPDPSDRARRHPRQIQEAAGGDRRAPGRAQVALSRSR